MTRISLADRLPLPTQRTVTADGYLVVPGTLARTGTQDYLAHELGFDGDPMRRVTLLRPADEVFAPASLRSFDGAPITVEHPAGGVSAANWRELAVGEVRDVRRAGDLMTGVLTLRDAKAIAALDAGKAELSNGYSFELDPTPGMHEGIAYDGVQRNIQGNHVALVDAARCGFACRVADSDPTASTPERTAMADALRKVVVDGIPLELSEVAAAALDKIIAARDKASADLAAATKAHGEAVAKLASDHAAALAAKDAEADRLRQDVMTPAARDALVKDWAAMLDVARRLAPTVATDGRTCVEIRRAVVAEVTAKDSTAKAVADAVLAGKAIDAADADVLRAVFGAIAALKPVATQGAHAAHDALGQVLAGASAGGVAAQAAADAAPVGREAMLARQRAAFEGK